MKHWNQLTIWALLALMATAVSAQDGKSPEKIRRIDIVHMTHTDIGFTDHPLVCRRQQMRFLDIAIDAVLATNNAPPEGQFYWTAETTLAVDDWWQAADAVRRKKFLDAVNTGRLEITALAMNQTPTLNSAQWQTTLHWLPDNLWDKVQPRAAVQNDVNGFPPCRRHGASRSRRRQTAHGHQRNQWGPAYETSIRVLVEDARWS